MPIHYSHSLASWMSHYGLSTMYSSMYMRVIYAVLLLLSIYTTHNNKMNE